jgi:hypothetical protein
MKPLSALSVGLLALGLLACKDRASEPRKDAPAPAPLETTPPIAPGSPAKLEGDIGWQKPAAWNEVQHPSKMRKATYAIPKVEGDPEDAEMTVTQVGGGVAANIERWEGQFEEKPSAKIEKKTVDGLEISIVELEGTYRGGMGPMMGGDTEPKNDWALLAVVVATEPAHFFKMTGPKNTVNAARGDVEQLVASIAKK